MFLRRMESAVRTRMQSHLLEVVVHTDVSIPNNERGVLVQYFEAGVVPVTRACLSPDLIGEPTGQLAAS